MKKFVKSFALTVGEKHDVDGYHLYKDDVVIVYGVVNPEEDKEKWVYQVTWKGFPVTIPALKCEDIKSINPEVKEKIDNWFDKESDNYVKNEPPPKEYSEVVLVMKKRENAYSKCEKSITFKLPDKDKITTDDIINLKIDLHIAIQNKEEDYYHKSDGDSYNLSWISAVSDNKIAFIFGDRDGDGAPSSEIKKYWKFVLNYLNLKEEPPKYTKLRSPELYGVSRFPDYNDMFYLRTDAKIETVNEFYDGSIKKLVEKLKETGFKADLENMDYILVEDGGNDIVKTNSLAL